MNCPQPAWSGSEATEAAKVLFGLDCNEGVSLGSERDQAFMLLLNGVKVGVLKVSNAAQDTLSLDLEAAAALHVQALDSTIPVALPLPPLPGRSSSDTRAAWVLPSAPHSKSTSPSQSPSISNWCRLYRVVPGRTLEFEDGPLPVLTLQRWGAGLAKVGRALRGFWHPAMARPTAWDVQVGLSAPPRSNPSCMHARVMCSPALFIL